MEICANTDIKDFLLHFMFSISLNLNLAGIQAILSSWRSDPAQMRRVQAAGYSSTAVQTALALQSHIQPLIFYHVLWRL